MKKKELEALLEISKAASSTLDEQEVLFIIVKKIAEVIRLSRCSIIQVEETNPQVGHVLATFEDDRMRGIPLDLRKYPEITKAVITGESVVIENAMTDPLMNDVRDILRQAHVRCVAAIPIIYQDKVLGTLFLKTAKPSGVFSTTEVTFCEVVANVAANAIKNANRYRLVVEERNRLERDSVNDYLTDTYNHRFLIRQLEDHFRRTQRHYLALSCVMLDLDNFKKINDTLGHRMGDYVLRGLAQVIKKVVRKDDIFSRYGGEEFVIILPHTAEKGAFVEAERVRLAVKEASYGIHGHDVRITISLGVATFPHLKIKSVDELLGAADKAMYEAKRQGKDRTISFADIS